MTKVILNFEGEQHELTTDEAPEQGASELNDLLSAADDYIEILERKIRSLDPYASMMPWDRPKDTDIAGAKGRWLAVKSIENVKGR